MKCKVAVMGAGVMGRMVSEIAQKNACIDFMGMIEPLNGEKLEDIQETDVILDFSHPNNLQSICNYAKGRGCAVVIATTGHGKEEKEMIAELSKSVPVVMSANFSIGVAVVKQVLEKISPILKNDFDIEIVEKHHRRKLDAPSGTALALAAAVDKEKEYEWIFGRHGESKRGKEIAIHGIRGGTIVGEHSVIFAGEDEVIEINHSASSRRIFAVGALKASCFAAESAPGLYTAEEALSVL
ncbi:MAG: 4-hydroxy-tetrahydrodipicolinate reductase [Eubacteriales bacterium]|nr:4-hydroxy-tetrahydrodipicolinate reductase [Eubacteriales bacterium]MDD4389172.1 4-hydroxy-tetrahydrodipicolinate reductase [Eubacteriales bacterium]